MQRPTVSVVIPSFNNAPHIEGTLGSVFEQTFPDFEVVISDHGSTDGTWELLQRYADHPRLTITRIERGGGAERNWNHVTSLARGKYLKLVCGDDLLRPESLARQVQAFQSAGEGVVLVTSKRSVIDNRGRTVLHARGLGRLSGHVAGGSAARSVVRSGTNTIGEPCCVMFRRDALFDAGLWEGSNGYVIDLATYLKVLRLGDLYAIPEPLAAFRVSAGQWSVELEHEQEWQVHEFRRRVREQWPGQFSRRDLVQGALMTKLHVWQRRAAYRVLAHRM